MGHGESENDKGSGQGGEGSVFCSICLDAVVSGNGERSTAKLLCGHDFHLDCIGSAFNAKGLMQCPNCRKIEKGNWLYANGYHCSPEANMDDIDWTHDEELIDFFEQVHRVHWCPYSRYERISSPIEEAEFPTFGYHDLSGHQITFSEHAANSSAAQACPHVAFFQPLHPSSSNSAVSNEAAIDGCTFQGPWSGTASSDTSTSHSFASADVHYSGWEHNSAPYTPPTSHVNGEDQFLMPFSSTMAGSFEHPFICGPGSGSQAGSSLSTIPPSREVPTSYRHDPSPDFLLRPDTMWGSMASSEHSPLYFCLPPCPPLQLNLGAENPNHFYAWERDRLAPYPMVPPDRLPNRWTPSFNQSAGEFNRLNSRRHMFYDSSSSHRSVHPPRLHRFI